MKLTTRSLLLATGLAAGGAQAAVTAYSDKATFLADTSAAQVSAPYPAAGPVLSLTSGSVTFDSGNDIYFGEYSTRLVGRVASISGLEHLNMQFAAPVYSFGFDFVEPEFDPLVNAAFVDSTFTVTLRKGGLSVGSFQFNAPNDATAFVGAWSTAAFDRAEIVETTGGIENEFYGQVYAGSLAPVPEPATYALMLAGMGLAGLAARSKRKLDLPR